MATDITLARVVQAGAMPIDTYAVLAELMSTWNRPDAMDFAAVMVDHIVPPYRALMESYDKAQSVQKVGRETKLDLLEASARSVLCGNMGFIVEASMQPTNAAQSVKKLRGIQRSVDRHWVGDGFPVRTLFAYPNLGVVLSPFLLLDYAGPMEFAPTDERRGVGEHPHRGFETVTIVYEGEVEHRDSSGGGGKSAPATCSG